MENDEKNMNLKITKTSEQIRPMAVALIAAATPIVATATQPSIMSLALYACQTLVTKNDSKE